MPKKCKTGHKTQREGGVWLPKISTLHTPHANFRGLSHKPQIHDGVCLGWICQAGRQATSPTIGACVLRACVLGLLVGICQAFSVGWGRGLQRDSGRVTLARAVTKKACLHPRKRTQALKQRKPVRASVTLNEIIPTP